MDWQIRWNFDNHRHVAAEKEQHARRETLVDEARKERDSLRQRRNR